MTQELARYEVDGKEVVLTDTDLMKVINDNPNVTRKEMKLFVELCKAQKLNPFIGDAYLIKYGDNPAQFVTGKNTFLKRAYAHPKFNGFEAGITYLQEGKIKRDKGSLCPPNGQLIGGWCKVFVDGYEVPMYNEVSLDEYCPENPKPKSPWKRMPATMIRKVATCQSLRESFPNELGGLYDSCEMNVELPKKQKEIKAELVPPEVKEYVSEADYQEDEGAKNNVVDLFTQQARRKLNEVRKQHEAHFRLHNGATAVRINGRRDYEQTKEFYDRMAEELQAEIDADKTNIS